MQKSKFITIVALLLFISAMILFLQFRKQNQSCEDGNSKKCYELASSEISKKNFGKAKELLQISCDKLHFLSCNDLGALEKTEKNLERSSYFFRKSCDGSNALGCLNYGNNLAMENNFEVAIQAYKKSCDLNNERGCVSAGYLFMNIKKSKEALRYFKIACKEMNSRVGCFGSGKVIPSLFGEEGINQRDALLYFSKSCSLGLTEACSEENELKHYYDKEDAEFSRLKKISETNCNKGNIKECGNLGLLEYNHGNKESAKSLLKQSCDNGEQTHCIFYEEYFENKK